MLASLFEILRNFQKDFSKIKVRCNWTERVLHQNLMIKNNKYLLHEKILGKPDANLKTEAVTQRGSVKKVIIKNVKVNWKLPATEYLVS